MRESIVEEVKRRWAIRALKYQDKADKVRNKTWAIAGSKRADDLDKMAALSARASTDPKIRRELILDRLGKGGVVAGATYGGLKGGTLLGKLAKRAKFGRIVGGVSGFAGGKLAYDLTARRKHLASMERRYAPVAEDSVTREDLIEAILQEMASAGVFTPGSPGPTSHKNWGLIKAAKPPYVLQDKGESAVQVGRAF